MILIYKLENYDVQLEYLYKYWDRSCGKSIWSRLWFYRSKQSKSLGMEIINKIKRNWI